MKKTGTKSVVIFSDSESQFSLSSTRLTELEENRYARLRSIGSRIRKHERSRELYSGTAILVYGEKGHWPNIMYDVWFSPGLLSVGCQSFSGDNYKTLRHHALRATRKTSRKGLK